MGYFVFGITKNVTRPFDDKEAQIMVKYFSKTQKMKLSCAAVFSIWGLYLFAFRENSDYFGNFDKNKIFSSFSVTQLGNIVCTVGSK